MEAFILAGGKGTRLSPYTAVLPKPLVPIGEIPILEILLRQLAAHGVERATLSVGYLESLIRAYFQPARIPEGLDLAYVSEIEPLGTAGSLSLLPSPPEKPLLVLNGDVLTTLDFRELLAHHGREDAALTIAVSERVVPIDLGVLDIGPDGLLRDYREKPKLSYSVSMGVYVYGPAAFRFIRPGERLDFPDLVLKLLEAGERVAAYRSPDLWLDIGSPEDHRRACEVFASTPDRFLPPRPGPAPVR